jgi:hypothetical protein
MLFIREAGRGAFVDLNFTNKFGYNSYPPVLQFGGNVAGSSQLGQAQAGVYDTWAYDYEMDGIDQDADGTMDQGSNGLDDGILVSSPNVRATRNGVDDPGERETSPPYPLPLRGIQVRIRLMESDTRQVRQTAVVREFTPE